MYKVETDIELTKESIFWNNFVIIYYRLMQIAFLHRAMQEAQSRRKPQLHFEDAADRLNEHIGSWGLHTQNLFKRLRGVFTKMEYTPANAEWTTLQLDELANFNRDEFMKLAQMIAKKATGAFYIGTGAVYYEIHIVRSISNTGQEITVSEKIHRNTRTEGDHRLFYEAVRASFSAPPPTVAYFKADLYVSRALQEAA